MNRTKQNISSTKPYLIRAIHEWCTDNGLTPYLAVQVGAGSRVPMEFVKDGKIVLDISFNATSALNIGNDDIRFKARFGGVSRDILIPIGQVTAIYARETSQGIAFPLESDNEADTTSTANVQSAQDAPSQPPRLQPVESEQNGLSDPPPEPSPPAPRPGGARLRRVK